MASSVLRGGNLVVTEEGIRQGVREMLLPLWSTWYFFSLYANTARPDGSGYEARWRTDSDDVLDRYILAKTGQLIDDVTADLGALDSSLAAAKLRDFGDVLTNWYVRRSRDRFWTGVGADGADTGAFDTLYTVLETLTRVAAPLLPLVSERIWKDLTGGRSVHLTDWPDASAFPREDDLVAAMDSVRAISSTALSLRKQSGLRVRLPLSALTVVATHTAGLAPFEAILREELNVKSVRLVEFEESSAERFGVTSRLTVNARAAGPRLGKNVQTVIKAARAGDWTETDGTVVAGGIALEEGEYELRLEASGTASGSALALLPAGGFLLLDTEVTPELEAEGLARDVIRAVQDARKAAGLDVSDRISLALRASDAEAEAAIREHGELISAETLSEELSVLREDAVQGDPWKAVGQGSQVRIEVAKR